MEDDSPDRGVSVAGSVRRKLLIAFTVVSVLTVIVGGVGVWGVTEASGTADSIANEGSQEVDGVMMLKLESQRERASLYRFVRDADGAREEFQAANEKWSKVYDSRLASSNDLSDRQLELMEQAVAKHDAAVEAAMAVMEAKRAGDTAAVRENLETYEQRQNELESILGNLEKETKGQMAMQVESANETQRLSSLAVLVLTLLSAGVGITFAWRAGSNIGGEVRRLSNIAERVAAGEFDFSVETSDREDEIGDLSRAFARMTDYLQTVSGQAEAVADQEFDDPVLDRQAPGRLGEVMMQMADDIETAQRDLRSLNESLEQTAASYRETMDRAADGDLSQRMDADSENAAMDDVGEAFNDMMDEFEATVATIRRFTDEVSESSDAVQSGSEEIGSASQEVSESVQQIASSADRQREDLRQVNQELQSLSGSIEEIASSADEVAATAQTATDRSQSGREAATTAIDEMDRIEATAEQTLTEVESLASEVAEIGEIVELINEVAEQTNMLALNASIEAARAGEAGEGFAVVADEIKSLATEVSEATDDIEALIGDVQASTDEAVGDMQTLGERVTTGADTIEGALADFDEVVDVIEDLNNGVQEISNATGDQAASTEEAVSMVEEVTDAASQASDEAEQASAATEQQTASLQEITDQIGGLADSTDELERFLDEFEVDGASGVAVGSGSPAATGVAAESVDD